MITKHRFLIKKRVHKEKIRKLKKDKCNQKIKLFKPVELIPDYVINLSTVQFNENENILLNRGLNFSVPDKKIPKDDIIVDTEVALKWVNVEENNLARTQLKTILKDEFENNNIKRSIPTFAKTETINSLQDKDVFYLKADKCNKVVIMNKNYYTARLEAAIEAGPSGSGSIKTNGKRSRRS